MPPGPIPAPSWLGPQFAGVISAWSHRAYGCYVPDQAMRGLIAHLDAWAADMSQASMIDGEIAAWMAASWEGGAPGDREDAATMGSGAWRGSR